MRAPEREQNGWQNHPHRCCIREKKLSNLSSRLDEMMQNFQIWKTSFQLAVQKTGRSDDAGILQPFRVKRSVQSAKKRHLRTSWRICCSDGAVLFSLHRFHCGFLCCCKLIKSATVSSDTEAVITIIFFSHQSRDMYILPKELAASAFCRWAKNHWSGVRVQWGRGICRPWKKIGSIWTVVGRSRTHSGMFLSSCFPPHVNCAKVSVNFQVGVRFSVCNVTCHTQSSESIWFVQKYNNPSVYLVVWFLSSSRCSKQLQEQKSFFFQLGF